MLISVTTIPAAANIGVAAATATADEALGAAAQLGINLVALVLAGVLTLFVPAPLLRGEAPPAPDGPGAASSRGRRSRPQPAASRAQSDDQMSIFVRTRAITSR